MFKELLRYVLPNELVDFFNLVNFRVPDFGGNRDDIHLNLQDKYVVLSG